MPAEGEERWRKYIDPDGVARIPDDEFRGLLARFEEVQRRYEELEGDYALRLSHLMAEEEHAKGLRADLERAQGFCREIAEARARCGRLLVGRGTDTWDPECVRPAGHEGVCSPGAEHEGAEADSGGFHGLTRAEIEATLSASEGMAVLPGREVGVSPEEEQDGRVVGWTQEEYTPALGRLHAAYLTLKDENQRLRAGGLAREEIEALLEATNWVDDPIATDWVDEAMRFSAGMVLARAKLRAYLDGSQSLELADAVRRFLDVWDEFDGPPLTVQDTYNAVSESVEGLRAYLGKDTQERTDDGD